MIGQSGPPLEGQPAPARGRRHPRGPLLRPRTRWILAGGAGALLLIVIVGLVALAARVHALRERHATGPAWAFPSIVYSDGLPFVAGRPLPHGYLARHLEARGYRAYPPAREGPPPGGYWWLNDSLVVVTVRGFEDARDPAGFGGPERVRLTLRGDRLARVERFGGITGQAAPDLAHPPRLEPWPVAQLSGTRDVRRTWVPLAHIPLVVQQAVIAAEDRRFRSHMGLDLKGNARAILANVRAGGVRQGGSTITQQLARGLFFGNKRTFGRKALEAITALGLEMILSKDQILEMYLNSVYWGQGEGRGVAGVGEAARWYFDAPVDSLKLNEAALLAGIIPSPNVFSPFRNRSAALAKRNSVLGDMVEAGVLDARVAATARARPLYVRQGTTHGDRFPSFVDYAGDYLTRNLPREAPQRWGLAIFTTADLVWQADAERALADGLRVLDGSRPGRGDRLEGAFVAIEPGTGAVRALVGGREPFPGDFDRATQARRQSGSSIKPLVYAAALETGRGGDSVWTAGSVVPNIPRTFTVDGEPWAPVNSDRTYSESITLLKALEHSVNVATVNLTEAIGPKTVAQYAERFGLGKLKPVLSIGLGSNEVTLLDLVDSYTAFPGGGVRVPARPVRAAIDANGKDLCAPPGKPVRVLNPATAAVMVRMLEDVVRFGISNPLVSVYQFGRPVAGKTGTTNDAKDAWFVGFVPQLAAGAWVGYDLPRTLGRSASAVALPVWARVMKRLVDGFPKDEFPADPRVTEASVDGITGGLPRSDCPTVVRAPFIAGTEPRWRCARDHTQDWIYIALEAMQRDSIDQAEEDSAAAVLGGGMIGPPAPGSPERQRP